MSDEEKVQPETAAAKPAATEESRIAGQPDGGTAGEPGSQTAGERDSQIAEEPESQTSEEPDSRTAGQPESPVLEKEPESQMPSGPAAPADGQPQAAELAPLPAETDVQREARKAFAVESARQRQEFINKTAEALAAWTEVLSEPGKTSLRALVRREQEFRSLRTAIYGARLTRRDWSQVKDAYQSASAEMLKRKEQASSSARGYLQTRADEIIVLLGSDGPNAALARLKEVQHERTRCLLSKTDWDEAERVLEGVYQQIHEAGRRLSPWYRRLESQTDRARQFLGRLERQAAWLRSQIADSRRQWEVEGNALRAALLKQQFTDGDAELERLTVKMADVRKQVEWFEAKMKGTNRKRPSDPVTQ